MHLVKQMRYFFFNLIFFYPISNNSFWDSFGGWKFIDQKKDFTIHFVNSSTKTCFLSFFPLPLIKRVLLAIVWSMKGCRFLFFTFFSVIEQTNSFRVRLVNEIMYISFLSFLKYFTNGMVLFRISLKNYMR